jgi:hypothetical protein
MKTTPQPTPNTMKIDVTIWRHKEDGHLFVDYCIGGGPIRVLIRAEDMDGYIKLVQASAQADQAAALSQLSKSIIAFIRHGHGEDTIDEYGDWSEDDSRRRDEEQAREAAETLRPVIRVDGNKRGNPDLPLLWVYLLR